MEAYRIGTDMKKNSGVRFGAAILDLAVKDGMGGKDALQELMHIDPGIKAIISSGYTDNEVIEKHRDYGFIGAITKPYKAQKLKEPLEKVIRKKAAAERTVVTQPTLVEIFFQKEFYISYNNSVCATGKPGF